MRGGGHALDGTNGLGGVSEASAVLGRRESALPLEVVTQQGGGSESAAVGDVLDGKIGPFQQILREKYSLCREPSSGSGPGLGGEPAGEGARGHRGAGRQRFDRVRCGEMVAEPVEQVGDATRGAVGGRTFDELPLTAVALR